jgi:hypothetical protein
MKVLKISFSVIMVMFMAWFVLSWLNIGFNNSVPNPVYQPWNLFIIGRGMV